MTAIDIVAIIGLAYAAIWSSYLLLLPVLATLRGPVPVGRRSLLEEEWPQLTVIVPARDMAEVIAGCVRSLGAGDYPKEKVVVYVVADHCADDTAEIARAAGASVLVRNEGQSGKTYTLAWAFDALAKHGVTSDIYVVVDATARVGRGFLTALVSVWRGGEDIIVGHAVVDADNRKWFAQCLGLTLVHRNLQNRSREQLGLSALIEGRGMAYSHNYIRQFGWRLAAPTSSRASHPTEDWRHAVRAVEHGYRVAFADDARIYTPLRGSLAAATRQGARWERGRMANAVTHGLQLLLRGLRQRNRLKAIAGLDAIQPPVAILGAVAALLAVLPTIAVTRLDATVVSVPLLLVFLYGLVVIAKARSEGIRLRTVLWAPVYIAWRCFAFLLAWVSFDRLLFAGQRRNAKERLKTKAN